MYSCGDEQFRNGPPSSAHSKVEPAWSDVNSNLAVVLVVSESGARVIVVSGRATMLHSWRAGDPSRFPAASTARASNTWSAIARAL